MKRAALLAFAVLMLAFQLVPVTGADDYGNWTLSGKVISNSTKEPVKGAEITVGTYNSVTFDDGFYSMKMPDGTYKIKVTASGYKTYSGTVTIQGGNVTKDIELGKQTTSSDCVIFGPALLFPLVAVGLVWYRSEMA